jgi:hypothetical protein
MQHTLVSAFVAVLFTCSSFASAATIYVAGADLKANELGVNSNPNGAWTYGTAATTGAPFQVVDLSTFTPYGAPQHTEAWLGVPQLQGYTDDDSDKTSIVVVNVDAVPVTACCGFQIDPSKIFVHAGVVAQRDAVIQWTAPGDGTITIGAEWLLKGSAPGLHQVFQNNSPLTAAAFGTDTFSSGVLNVASGDIISFVQGPQSSGAFGSTSTQFDATISFAPVPEPSSIALASLALACLAWTGVRRRLA